MILPQQNLDFANFGQKMILANHDFTETKFRRLRPRKDDFSEPWFYSKLLKNFLTFFMNLLTPQCFVEKHCVSHFAVSKNNNISVFSFIFLRGLSTMFRCTTLYFHFAWRRLFWWGKNRRNDIQIRMRCIINFQIDILISQYENNTLQNESQEHRRETSETTMLPRSGKIQIWKKRDACQN